MSGDRSGYRTALQIREEEERRRGAPLAASPALADQDRLDSLVIRAELPLDSAEAIWNTFTSFRNSILENPACYDVIAGSKEINRTGAMRLALPFGLSIEERDVTEGRVQDADSGEYDYRFIVRVRVSKGARHVDGIGSCRLSEIADKTAKGEPVPVSQREHFALTRAWTRAAKRAISDALGGTDAD